MGGENLQKHLQSVNIETEEDIMHYAKIITIPLREFHQGIFLYKYYKKYKRFEIWYFNE